MDRLVNPTDVRSVFESYGCLDVYEEHLKGNFRSVNPAGLIHGLIITFYKISKRSYFVLFLPIFKM